jgi:hypothetical protein
MRLKLPKRTRCAPRPAFPTCHYTPRHRPMLTTLLIILCVPIAFYQLVPSSTQAADDAVNTLASKLLRQTLMCTADIGDAQCYTLYLDTAPCLDECRKEHVDRETFTLTLQYKECADQCLVTYNHACAHSSTPTEHVRVFQQT